MAERSLPRKLLTLPRFPVVARAIALVMLLSMLGALAVYFYTRKPATAPPPEEAQLNGEITAIFEHFRHLETKGGKDKYLLTADLDRAYSNGSHELVNVELISFGAEGERKD